MLIINFTFNGKEVSFKSERLTDIYRKVIDWLDMNGYDFDNELHRSFVWKVFSKDEMDNFDKYESSRFHNINGKGRFILASKKNSSEILSQIYKMLKKFGISESTISTDGFDGTKIVKFSDHEHQNSIDGTNTINPFGGKNGTSAICVLGESGAGKSYTIEEILKNEGHEYEFIIPTAATTGLLSQFSPSKNTYVLSKLGKIIVEASKNPDTLYTVVFDEIHKYITMIDDELLQAISTKRNRFRFISLDPDTAELYQEASLKNVGGRLKIPDNLGFIFITSKPKVIANNPDFANRVDLIRITEADRNIKTISELLSKREENTYSNKREESTDESVDHIISIRDFLKNK